MKTLAKNEPKTNQTIPESLLFIIFFTIINSIFVAYTSILYMFFQTISGRTHDLDHMTPAEYMPVGTAITIIFLATAIAICRKRMSPWTSIFGILIAGLVEGIMVAISSSIIANHS